MSNVSIAGYAGWPAYDTFLIMSLSGWPVYDPNPLRPNPNPKKPVSGSCRVRGLGWTLTPLLAGSSECSTHWPPTKDIQKGRACYYFHGQRCKVTTSSSWWCNCYYFDDCKLRRLAHLWHVSYHVAFGLICLWPKPTKAQP